MDLRRLEVFCRVVEQKSFTRAAQMLLLSQPSVSEHLRALEEDLGEKLVDRLGREVLATGAGDILYGYACQMLHLRNEARQALEQYRGNLAGQLALGASTIPGAYLLPGIIDAFKKLYPQCELQLRIRGSSQILTDLLHNSLELALVGAPVQDTRFQGQQAFGDELILVVSPDHPWAGCSGVEPRDMETQPLVLRESGSGTRSIMEESLKQLGVAMAGLQVVAEVGSNEAVRQAVKANIGISILSHLAVAEDINQGRLVHVPVQGLCLTRHFYLVQRRQRQLSPLAAAFRQQLLQQAHQEADSSFSSAAS